MDDLPVQTGSYTLVFRLAACRVVCLPGKCWGIWRSACQALCSLPGAAVPIPGLGAGDRRAGCPAHRVRIAGVPGLDDALRKRISAILSAGVMLLTKL